MPLWRRSQAPSEQSRKLRHRVGTEGFTQAWDAASKRRLSRLTVIAKVLASLQPKLLAMRDAILARRNSARQMETERPVFATRFVMISDY